MDVRIATFNCENLFARFKFSSNADPGKAVKDGWSVDKTKFDILKPVEKKLTGKAILETGADIIALQEVENLDTLRKFRTDYLGGRKRFPYCIAIDGNDPRRIDVALLSRYPIENIATHVDEYDSSARSYEFSRDCLECDAVLPNSKRIRFFINHLKSMLDKKDPCNGRENTRKRRQRQAERVKEIVSEEMNPDKDHFVILGDFNDYPEDDSHGKSAIMDLVGWSKVENVLERLPEQERWTHYYKGTKKCGNLDSYKQIDYILISKSLAKANPDAVPTVIRKGITTDAKRYTGARFAGVGAKTAASDHCPVSISLNV
ncbi:endonuclease/exonuclease/phosphatase family protein [Candidatus Nitrosotenuis cloacae]|uniref:endonuclease/exonuclease/phosphatase family protein n=1 Tax=Candidatus Nitrosotenuis cloacae TaxID=1603555 RepID=UPI00227E49B3|nr:endonuclease/exonuclease/phosphatase family protein [Candidatus Nitrosotenuis cloacae]